MQPATTSAKHGNELQQDSLFKSKKPTLSLSQTANNSLSATINYTYKPPNGLTANFKCVKLAESGKKCKKKNLENFRVDLASTKLFFIKEGKVPKLDLYIDFKGGKCYRVDKHSLSVNTTLNSITLSGSSSTSTATQKLLKEKEKERTELLDLVGSSKSGFMVETLNGYKMLVINENASLVGEWVSAINAIIQQIVSVCFDKFHTLFLLYPLFIILFISTYYTYYY
jgi:hypothetical protein